MNADHFLNDIWRAVHIGTPRGHHHIPVARLIFGHFEAQRGKDALLFAIGDINAAKASGQRRIVGHDLARQRRLPCADDFASLATADVDDQAGENVHAGIEKRRIHPAFEPAPRV